MSDRQSDEEGFPKNFGTLLDRVCRVETVGREAADRPRVEISLNSGATVAGVIVQSGPAIVRVVDGRKMTFIAVNAIVAVSVLDASDVADILTGGREERGGDAPAALNISRQAKALSDRLHRRIDVDIPSGESHRLALSRLLDELGPALDHIVAKYGSDFSVDAIRVEPGMPSVELKDGTLIVRAWLDGGVSGRLRGAALIEAIEKAC